MQLNRRALLGGAAASALSAAAHAQILTSGGKLLVSGGSVLTAPPVPAPPAGGLLSTQITLTNPAGQPTQTNPYFSFGLPIARSEYPASGYKLALYNASGSSKITDLQVDQKAAGWRPDLSNNYAVVSGYATGTTLAAGATATFTVKAEAGASPSTPVCTTATLAANSDIRALCKIGTDSFTVSVNSIIANFSGAPQLYPLGYIRQWKSGPYCSEWCFGQYLKRDSDGGYHRWAFLKLYVTALSASGPFLIRGYLENANTYGPNPNGTVGPTALTSPLVLVDSIDVYNGASFICALGGVNDANNGTFSPSNVNLTTSGIAATFSGGLDGSALGHAGNPIGFVSTGTLPAGISPASAQTYWAVVDGTTKEVYALTDRTYATAIINGAYVKMATPVSGTSVAIHKWIQANGGIYLCTTAGVSTGRLPTGAVFADNSSGGTLVWTLISPQITNQGTGTHTMVMKAAVVGGSKAPLMGPDTYPFWHGAGSLPKLLVGYDRNYVFGKTHSMLPLDPGVQCGSWIGPLPRFVQNVMYLPGAPGTYYIGNVSESQMDERVNQQSPTAMASICLPTDVGLATSCRFMALSWVDRNASWRDERVQEVHVVNYGPDRLGASYPGLAPNNPTLVLGGVPAGNPKPIPYNTVWGGYGGFLFGPAAPDPAHTPNVPYWPALTSGDPIFFDALFELAGLMIGCSSGGVQVRSALINGVNMTWAWSFMQQTRGAGHELEIFTQAEWITPEAHPLKAYFSDVMDDSADIGMLWANQKVGPNAQAVGYIPFLYPPGPSSLQGQETWMMGYLQMAHMHNVLKGNRPGFRTFNETYFYKALLPLFDSDVGGSEKMIDIQWDVIGNQNGGPDPPLDSQFLFAVPDRLRGNPQIFKRINVLPPPQDLFVSGTTVNTGGTDYTYRVPGSIGSIGGGNSAAFPGNAYGLTERSVCEMGAMAGLSYYQKIADRIQALLDRSYAGNPCNWANQALVGNPNGIMYAMKRQ